MSQPARHLRRQQTEAERRLWSRLRRRGLSGYKFRRQHPVAGFVTDFACPEAGLVVEVDGGQHLTEAADDAARSRALEEPKATGWCASGTTRCWRRPRRFWRRSCGCWRGKGETKRGRCGCAATDHPSPCPSPLEGEREWPPLPERSPL